MIFKRKLIMNSMILTILLVFALQITIFGISVSPKNNVTGIVYASSGVPLSSVSVFASGSEGHGYATTDGSGHYLISKGLKTGTYTVSAIKEGYIDTEIGSIQVTALSETANVNLYLNISGGISGNVADSITSFGIKDIVVFASPSSGSGTYFGSGVTDVIGNYHIDMNLATGTYNVSVLMPQGYISKTVSPVSVTAGSWTTGVNVTLQLSGIISGRITTPNGQPLANQTVIASSSDSGGYYGFAETNATGYYRIATGLGTGQYTVMAGTFPSMNITTTPISVTAHQETPNIDLELTITPPAASGIIMGKVTDIDTGKPIQDADVSAVGDTHYKSGSAFTDANGNYVISEGLTSTDTYTVTASATGYQDQNVTGVNVVVSQTTQNINLQLTPIPAAQSGSISGTVSGDTNPIPEFEYPIAIMLVLTLVAVAVARKSDRKTKY